MNAKAENSEEALRQEVCSTDLLCAEVEQYLDQLAPHVASREAAKLLRQSLLEMRELHTALTETTKMLWHLDNKQLINTWCPDEEAEREAEHFAFLTKETLEMGLNVLRT